MTREAAIYPKKKIRVEYKISENGIVSNVKSLKINPIRIVNIVNEKVVSKHCTKYFIFNTPFPKDIIMKWLGK